MSLYSEDELNTPAWLTREFFEKVISSYENDEEVEVFDLDITPASMKGDHFASIMFRAKLAYRFTKDGPINKKSLIIKAMPTEQSLKRDFLKNSKFFENEFAMYDKTLPALERLLAKQGVITKFAPNMIYYELQPHKVIILEDLCAQGYDVLHERYLKAEDIRVVFRKLAKLHAASFILAQSAADKAIVTQHTGKHLISKVFRQSLLVAIEKFIAMLMKIKELVEYIPKFVEIKQDIFEECYKLYGAYENDVKNEIYVLNHGDLHLKNLLFKFNKQDELIDFRMVDFQMSVFAPLNIDLSYASFMLLSSEQRLQRHAVYHDYFEAFADSLKSLKYRGVLPKFVDIQMANLRYRFYNICVLALFLPMHYAAHSRSPEELRHKPYTDFFAQEKRDQFYCEPAYIADVKKSLPMLLKEGYLD